MRRRWVRAVNTLVLAALAGAFAVANGAQRVELELGIVTIPPVPLYVVVFVSFLAGMLIVLLAGLRADLRTRDQLRRYRERLRGEE